MFRGSWTPLVAILSLAALAPLPSRAAEAERSVELRCPDLGELMTHYLRRHVRYGEVDDTLRQWTADTYLERVDPQRSLFLAADVERWKRELVPGVNAIRGGECGVLQRMREDVARRLAAEEAYVRAFVNAADYKVDPAAKLVVDPAERGWPTDGPAREALLRTLAHFQITNYLNAGIDLAEAKKRLVHRYELRTRRWGEQQSWEVHAAFLNAFANSLDPHSVYLSADDLEDFQIGMQLSLQGIGVALSERDGYAVVEEVIPLGAADKLGVLKRQDKIIGVAEEDAQFVDVIDMRLRDIVRLIRGKKGSRVRLKVLREGEKVERFELAIVRDNIDLEDQAAKLRFETREVDGRTLKLAVVELPSFYGDRDPSKRQGSRDLEKILRQVREQKSDGLLLDLSRNGGGLLEDAVRISGFFIAEGAVVGIRGTTERSRVLQDVDDETLYAGPLVVLTSRVSASASEILAGALQDYRRAVIVGDDQTFGKGTVQSVFPLPPGLGALKVTTALFFRPGGASTQASGVASDVVVPSPFNLELFGEKKLPHALPQQSVPPFPSTSANAAGEGRWRPLPADLMSTLRTRSEARQQGDEALKKVRSELAERSGDDGVLEIAEILKPEERHRDLRHARRGRRRRARRRGHGRDRRRARGRGPGRSRPRQAHAAARGGAPRAGRPRGAPAARGRLPLLERAARAKVRPPPRR
jgi:carboxyl-terminal processing protease